MLLLLLKCARRELLLDPFRICAEPFQIITPLGFATRFLQQWGLADLLTKMLEPLLTLLGMGRQAAPLVIFGITPGLSCAGGPMIRETQLRRLSQQDIDSTITCPVSTDWIHEKKEFRCC